MIRKLSLKNLLQQLQSKNRMNIARIRLDIVKRLTANSIDPYEAGVEADLLIEHFLDIDKNDLLIRPDVDIKDTRLEALLESVDLRVKKRIPVQYITGYAYFYGSRFLVNQHVLIPRNDTEILVEKAIQTLAGSENIHIADIGTGSGVIVVIILMYCKRCTAIATDISEDALNIARQNACLNRVSDRVRFVKTNYLRDIDIKFNAILANPPYIPMKDRVKLAPEVALHEPEQALFCSNSDPVEHYREISREAKDKLHNGGHLFFELNSDTVCDVRTLVEKEGWQNISIYNDLNRLPRVLHCQKS